MRAIVFRRLGRWASAVTVLALAAALGILVSSDTGEATSFAPVATVCLDNATTVDPDPFTTGGQPQECDGDPTPGVTSDITTGLNIQPPDSNFGSGVGFLPVEWGAASDADIPDGAVVGELTSQATLSLGASACNTSLTVNFTMVDGTTDTSNTIVPTGPTEDPLRNLAGDDDGNGIFDAADQYPSYLNELFPGITPRSRQVGWTEPVTDLTVILNFLLFEPGTTLPEQEVSPQERLGFPNLTVLQDPTAAPGASLVGDFCTPLKVSITTFGVTRDNTCTPAPGPCALDNLFRLEPVAGDTGTGEGGNPYRTNPPDGEYSFVAFARSLYDADDDGLENTMDTCPWDPTPNFDPRSNENPGLDDDLFAGQPNADGVPAVCDPDDDNPVFVDVPPCPTSGIFDLDGDCFSDRGDNCPLDPNGIDDVGNLIPPGGDNQEDTDSDGIGDACDGVVSLGNPQGLGDPNSPDGHRHELCNLTTLIVGAGGGRLFKDIPISSTICQGVAVAEAVAGVTDSGDTDSGDTDSGDTDSGDTGGGTGGTGGGPDTGVGSLAPVVGSIPGWAAIASGLGGAGLLGSLAALVGRIRRRR